MEVKTEISVIGICAVFSKNTEIQVSIYLGEIYSDWKKNNIHLFFRMEVVKTNNGTFGKFRKGKLSK